MVDLPAPERPVNQSIAGCWRLTCGARVAVDIERLPVDVVRAPQREMDHPRADRGVGERGRSG